MGNRVVSNKSVPEGLGCIIHNEDEMNDNDQIKFGSVYSKRGGKIVNQDSAVLCQGYGSTLDGVLCGVFDGHGEYGHVVSKAASRRLPLLLLNQKNAVLSSEVPTESQSTNCNGSSSLDKELVEWKTAFLNSFKEMDDEVMKMALKERYFTSGSTAVVALKQGDDLLIANLGDSRAILGTKGDNGVKAVQLTIDLTPRIPDEADRIRSFDGRVFALKNEPGVERAWMPRRNSPGMAMSRSFGDFFMKQCGIISTPVITHHHITSDDLFILLATDGIWDVLSNDKVASIVWGVENEKMASKAVVDAAVVEWKAKYSLDRPDDCTAVCYFLQKKVQTPSKPT
ncbi:hypothetical protein BVRB_2g033240 [Beta vulgaris subsp. vulgaris]|uniref:PPM-type phosphatase domain-containing protein n=1 Tax=Beta vulgaris subsp. vulgaris TaxID=3555 RepID=A0A0J8D1F1_BETVV|nr:hypothetical protein BVRB_2g033240 [Beta vulgaris subsp. vulgaris]